MNKKSALHKYNDVWSQTDFLINLLFYCAINRIAANPEKKENFRRNKCMYLGVYHFKIAFNNNNKKNDLTKARRHLKQ